jgi:hypothetical protein
LSERERERERERTELDSSISEMHSPYLEYLFAILLDVTHTHTLMRVTPTYERS